jgi:hypothetical protein
MPYASASCSFSSSGIYPITFYASLIFAYTDNFMDDNLQVRLHHPPPTHLVNIMFSKRDVQTPLPLPEMFEDILS